MPPRNRKPEITIANKQKRRVRLRVVRKFARHVLAWEGIAPECELSVVLCDECAISELNRVFLDRAGATDVLAFAQDVPPRQRAASEESVAVLGDVVICTDVALAQAEGRGVALEEEVLELLAHGMLHLLGYGDDTPSGRRTMTRKQEQLVRDFPQRESRGIEVPTSPEASRDPDSRRRREVGTSRH